MFSSAANASAPPVKRSVVTVNRVIVECRHYATTVGDEKMNALAGFVHQLGVDAAMPPRVY
jgi:hypothetical protein